MSYRAEAVRRRAGGELEAVRRRQLAPPLARLTARATRSRAAPRAAVQPALGLPAVHLTQLHHVSISTQAQTYPHICV